MQELEQAQKQYTLERFQKQLAQLDSLICDELDCLSFSRSGAELLFQVFADRYQPTSTLHTSNLPFSEWQQIFHVKRMTAALHLFLSSIFLSFGHDGDHAFARRIHHSATQ